VLQVTPPPGGEIEFAKVRELIYKLRQVCQVQWVTADKFQSRDFLQILRSRGYQVGIQSMDESPWAYEVTKQALYDGRVIAPEHPLLQAELVGLEKDLRNPKRPKVDHGSQGSKDCSDAMAGVVAGISRRMEIWLAHGLRPRDMPHRLAARPKRDGSDQGTGGGHARTKPT